MCSRRPGRRGRLEAGAGAHLAQPLVACRPGRVTWQGFVVVSPPLTWRESSLSPLLPCACVHTCVQACMLCVCLVWSHPGRRGERALGFCGGVFPDGHPGLERAAGWACSGSALGQVTFLELPPVVGGGGALGCSLQGPHPAGAVPVAGGGAGHS